MKTINTKQVLVNFKNEPLLDGKEEITIGGFLANVLAGKSSNPSLSWVLGKKFATEDTVDLKAEEIVFLKKELSTSPFNALATGQVMEILDSKE